MILERTQLQFYLYGMRVENIAKGAKKEKTYSKEKI